MKSSWKRYTHREMHDALIDVAYTGDNTPYDHTERQALFCPYYATLSGVLGADWGVVVNPESEKFGQLVFEHDECGCPPHPIGNQRDDEWLKK